MFRDRFCEVYFPDNWFSLLLSPSIILSEIVHCLVPWVKVKFRADVRTSQLILMAGVALLLDTRKWSVLTPTDLHIATASGCTAHGPPADWHVFSPICLFEFGFYLTVLGAAVAQWLRCCVTNWKVAGSIPAGVTGFFVDIKSFRSHYGPGVDSASNRNEYQGYFLGVKAAGA